MEEVTQQKCRAHGCENLHDADTDMCRPHWRRVSGELKMAIKNAVDPQERSSTVERALRSVEWCRNVG